MKVFLSSTALDLSEYRKVADDTILRLAQHSVAMERFGPLPDTPVEECERLARESDVVVCIVAHRYGYVPEKGRGSITRREVEAAHKAGKDVLVWIVADDFPWTEKKEQDLLADPNVLADDKRVAEVREGVAGLLDFKNWLRTTFTPDTFTTSDDLGRKIAVALANYVRGHSAPPIAQDKISIARLPTTGSELFGRETELQILDNAWANPNTNIVSFVAWGGVGKTALVNHWLKRRMARVSYRGAERVYGWSFFSQGTRERATSADLFIDHALRWFGDMDPREGSPWDKGERLAHYIRQSRTLLVLDGFEPLQHPPGPQEGRLKDATMQALLVELAAHQPGLCVISTRERIGDLIEFENSTVLQHDLEHLSSQAGAQILRSLKVKGENDELEKATKELGGHAFSLTLLGSYLDEVLNGDIRRRNEIENVFYDTRYGEAAQRLIAVYEKWLGDGIELAILRLLGFFDRPADLSTIEALRAPPVIAGLTEPLQDFKGRDWNQAVAKLRRIKLIGEISPDHPGTLDAHPLVREYFKQQLKRERIDAWRAGNNRLFEHLSETTEEFPDTVEEMSSLYSAVLHGCEAGKYKDALNEVYVRRIQRGREHYNWHSLAAYGADLASLSGFFTDVWNRPLPSLNDQVKGFVLNEVGTDLRALGRLQEAAQPTKIALDITIANEDWRNASRGAGNLTELYVSVGDLRNGLKVAQHGVDLADRSGELFIRVALRAVLGDVLHRQGHIDAAAIVFDEAKILHAETEGLNPLVYSWWGFLYFDFLLTMGEIQKVRRLAETALQYSTSSNWLVIIGLDHLSLGRAWMLAGKDGSNRDVVKAAELLNRAVFWLRRGGRIDRLPYGLLARANLHRSNGDFDHAEQDLTEVHRICTRSGMDLHLADFNLEAARLRLAQSDPNKARENLSIAKRMINHMGYHLRDKDVQELKAKLG